MDNPAELSDIADVAPPSRLAAWREWAGRTLPGLVAHLEVEDESGCIPDRWLAFFDRLGVANGRAASLRERVWFGLAGGVARLKVERESQPNYRAALQSFVRGPLADAPLTPTSRALVATALYRLADRLPQGRATLPT